MLLTLLQQNLAGGPRLYYVVGPTSGWATPTAAEIVAGTLSGGGAAAAASSMAAPTSTSTVTFPTTTGLSAGVGYTGAIVWWDGTTASNVVTTAWTQVSSGLTVGSQTVTASAAIVAGSITLEQSVAARVVSAGAPTISAGSILLSQAVASQTVSAGSPSITQGAIDVVQLVGAQVVAAGAPSISAGSILLSQEVAPQTLSASSSIVQGSIQLPGSVAAQVLSTPNPIIVQGAIDFPQSVATQTVTVTPTVSQGSIVLIAAPAVSPTVVAAGQGQVVQGFIGLEGASFEEFEEDAFALSYAAAWRRRSKTPAYFANRPSVSGTPAPGQILNASPGTWAPGATFVYQWAVGGVYVRGATNQTFTVRPEDAGKPIACCITANMPGGAKIPFVARV